MGNGSPLDRGDVPTAAAQLVIVLLPLDSQPTDSVVRDVSAIVGWPQIGVLPGPHEPVAVDPEFATCYQAEMPPLIGFLIKCGAHHRDAVSIAEEAFHELFEQWKTVAKPKHWLRQVAFGVFLRRPVTRTAYRDDGNNGHTSLGPSSGFDFGAEERLAIDMPRLLSTTHRAVLALHYDEFHVRDIAEILGMRPKRVRRNLARALAILKKSLNLDGNPWAGHGPAAGEGRGA
jgi:DNA-directed RNA polymerase specialized sigma24 family protein